MIEQTFPGHKYVGRKNIFLKDQSDFYTYHNWTSLAISAEYRNVETYFEENPEKYVGTLMTIRYYEKVFHRFQGSRKGKYYIAYDDLYDEVIKCPDFGLSQQETDDLLKGP